MKVKAIDQSECVQVAVVSVLVFIMVLVKVVEIETRPEHSTFKHVGYSETHIE